MQRPDEAKRRQILHEAVHLFASHPFHEVRLEDVADAAQVGKGTLYIYFTSKDDLYLTLVREGFADMVAQAKVNAASGRDVWQRLRSVVAGLIRFGTRYPDLYRVMRNGSLTPDDAELQNTRRELSSIVEGLLRAGCREKAMSDAHPEITAQFVLSFVRGALLYPPPGLTPLKLEDQIMRVLQNGIGARRAE